MGQGVATVTAMLRQPLPQQTDDTAALLHQILAELHALRAVVDLLAVRSPGRILGDDDRAALEPLLPAVYGLIGDRVWSVAVAVTVAATADDLAGALAPFVVTPGGLRRLGKLLRRADGLPIGGFVVQRVGDERTGALWRVSKAQETRETRATDGGSPQRVVSL